MLFIASCKQNAFQAPSSAPPTNAVTLASTNKLEQFELNGVVKELKPDGRTVVIAHEAIPNYMPAMTMPFEVKNLGELRGLKAGDAVRFQMVVAEYDAWIAHITKKEISADIAKNNFSVPGFRITREVDPLTVGDSLPEYHFTNELGQAVSTAQYLGQAFAFTFFFTRCPFPTYCPLLSNHYEAAQKQLLADPQSPTNWHLFSISFDVQSDPPEVLKSYAARYGYDPAHWSFLTGDLTEITAIGDQFGEYFGRDENGGISHNLRTVVVDARGRVQKIWGDNQWSASELADELIKGANMKAEK